VFWTGDGKGQNKKNYQVSALNRNVQREWKFVQFLVIEYKYGLGTEP